MGEATSAAQETAWNMSLMWYLAAYLPVLRQKPRPEILIIAQQCNEFNLREPLHLMPPAKRYEISDWQEGEKLTGNQVVALLIGCIWLLAGDSEENGYSLLLSFPFIKDALILARENE